MLILVPFNRKSIMKQQSSIRVGSIPEINLVILFKLVLLAHSYNQVLILMLGYWVFEIDCFGLVLGFLFFLPVIGFSVDCLEVVLYLLFVT